jgi:hypothetical protein
MAEKGFKRKLAAILSTDAKRYSRFVYDPEEPMPHNLTTYRTSMIDLAQQYRFNELCWAVGCNELQR